MTHVTMFTRRVPSQDPRRPLCILQPERGMSSNTHLLILNKIKWDKTQIHNMVRAISDSHSLLRGFENRVCFSSSWRKHVRPKKGGQSTRADRPRRVL